MPMIDPDDFDPLAYVTAMAPAVGFRLSPARRSELAEAFALVVRAGAPAPPPKIQHMASSCQISPPASWLATLWMQPRKAVKRLDALARASGESRSGYIAHLTLEERTA